MTNPTPLSPAAQAVFDTVVDETRPISEQREMAVDIAAALRAAADQVVPEDLQEAMHFTTEAIRLNKQGIRRQLLAIAAELEGAQ